MKKAKFLFSIGILVLLVGVVSAVPDLEVGKTVVDDVIIVDLDKSAEYELKIVNNGASDLFEIYTLVGVRIEPSEEFELPQGGETRLKVSAFPGEYLRETKRGLVSFEYQIRGRESGIFKDKFLVKIVELSDLFTVEVESLHPDDKEITVKVKNREDTRVDNITAVFDSVFFRSSETFSLGPQEEVSFDIDLNKEGKEKIVAGQYIVFANVVVEDAEASVEGVIDYLEKSGTSVEEISEGFIIRSTLSRRTNRGNTPVGAEIELNKDIISRLFTTYSEEPTRIERSGFSVTYYWGGNIAPGQALEVMVTTNYTFPFIFLIVIIIVGIVVWAYSRKAVILEKSVSLVRTKGGEFALKVKINVKARKKVDNVQLIDSLPRMVKLYNKFGKQPDRIEKHTRRLFWDVGNLTKGERRVYSYVIYSKLNVIGQFGLPAAQAIFEREKDVGESWSNRAFYAAEKD